MKFFEAVLGSVMCAALVACNTTSASHGEWLPASDNGYSEKLSRPVEAARTWAKKSIDTGTEGFHLEYHPVATDNGYIVYVNPVHIAPITGRHWDIATDDDWCVYVDSQYVVQDAKQCLSP